MQDKKDNLVKNALEVIRDNLGEKTTESYRAFFKKVDEALIKRLLHELLKELYGKKFADEQLQKLKEKCAAG